MEQFEKLKIRLEKQTWPAIYPFKFVVPIDKLTQALNCLNDFEVETKFSKKGNYASLSFKPFMLNPDHVIEVYTRLTAVKGIMAL